VPPPKVSPPSSPLSIFPLPFSLGRSLVQATRGHSPRQSPFSRVSRPRSSPWVPEGREGGGGRKGASRVQVTLEVRRGQLATHRTMPVCEKEGSTVSMPWHKRETLSYTDLLRFPLRCRDGGACVPRVRHPGRRKVRHRMCRHTEIKSWIHCIISSESRYLRCTHRTVQYMYVNTAQTYCTDVSTPHSFVFLSPVPVTAW